MSRAVIGRALVVYLVAILSITVAGQSAQKKPAQKKSPADVATPKAQPAKESAPAPVDLKIRTRYTAGAQVTENTAYIKGARQRVEFPGAVSIEQGDLGRTLLLNPGAKTYFVTRHGTTQQPDASQSPAPTGPSDQVEAMAKDKAPKGGIVTYTTTLSDTGERKPMFGHDARRVTTVIKREASPSACDRNAMTVEVDGWYIDLPVAATRPVRPAQPQPVSQKPVEACADHVESHTNGEAKLGFPVAATTTTKTGEGDKQETTTSSMEVTALETTTLPAALFEAPEGYAEVKSNADLMAGFQGNGGFSDALLGSTADGTSAAAPKREGAVRLGVLEPLDKSTHKLPTRELREELAGHFHKAPYEALTLASASLADAQAEAARTECDYILYSEIADIKTSKPGRMSGMLKKVSRDGPPRDVHEVRLDYRLYAVGGSGNPPAFGDTVKTTSGGGFSLQSALRLAMFAGSLYLRFTGLGLLNPTLMSNFSGGVGPLASAGLFDPRMSAMSSMTQLLRGGGLEAIAGDGSGAVPDAAAGPDPEIEIRQTVDAGLASAARGAMDQLRKNRKSR